MHEPLSHRNFRLETFGHENLYSPEFSGVQVVCTITGWEKFSDALLATNYELQHKKYIYIYSPSFSACDSSCIIEPMVFIFLLLSPDALICTWAIGRLCGKRPSSAIQHVHIGHLGILVPSTILMFQSKYLRQWKEGTVIRRQCI